MNNYKSPQYLRELLIKTAQTGGFNRDQYLKLAKDYRDRIEALDKIIDEHYQAIGELIISLSETYIFQRRTIDQIERQYSTNINARDSALAQNTEYYDNLREQILNRIDDIKERLRDYGINVNTV